MRGLKRTFAAAGAATLLVAAPAFAQVNPTEQGYSAPAGVTQQQITSSPGPSATVTPAPTTTHKVTPVAATTKAAPAKKGGLPFTGLELGLVLAAGAALLGAGLGLRRLSRPNGTA
jgi:hypothetical protein